MSRHFAGVGVTIPASRLRQIADGAPVADKELTDVRFALSATEMQRADRHAKVVHAKRQCMHWLVFLVMVFAALNLLFCMAYALFLALAPPPPL